MLNSIAKRYAKTQYRFRQLVEAETNELHARLADRLAQEHRDNAARITKEADEMDSRIKEVSDMEEKGYWLCENGHEHRNHVFSGFHSTNPEKKPACSECGESVKHIKRDEMSGQEKYESDKERGEAQDIAKQKRGQAKAEEGSAVESEKAAKYFRGIAQNNRSVAEKLRRA